MSGYPLTGLTKQRKSLREPLKVFPLPRHQHCFGQTFNDCLSWEASWVKGMMKNESALAT